MASTVYLAVTISSYRIECVFLPYRKLCVLDNSHSSLHTIYSLDHSPQEETFNSSYVSIDHSSPIQHTFTFTNTHHPHTGSNKPQETIFDDDIYGRHYIPPQPTTKASTVTESIDRETASEPLSNGGTKKRGSSLKRSSAIFQRGRQPSLRRAESQNNLLIDDEGGPDYDTLEPVVMDTLSEGAPRVPSKTLHSETRCVHVPVVLINSNHIHDLFKAFQSLLCTCTVPSHTIFSTTIVDAILL